MCWWRRGEGAGWRGGREAHQNVTFLIVVQFAKKKKKKKVNTENICMALASEVQWSCVLFCIVTQIKQVLERSMRKRLSVSR